MQLKFSPVRDVDVQGSVQGRDEVHHTSSIYTVQFTNYGRKLVCEES